MQNSNNFFGLFGNDADEIAGDEMVVMNRNDLNHCPKLEPQQQPSYEQLLAKYNDDNCKKLQIKNEKFCMICRLNQFKYSCPKCQWRTCSLICSKKHKYKMNCDGKREDSRDFVPLKNYNEKDFNSDLRFLEKCNETMKDAQRILANNPKKDNLSSWTTRFIQECQRRQIKYEKMPIIFKRSRLNQSIFIYKTKTILWDLEFIFKSSDDPASDDKILCKIFRHRISEKNLLKNIVTDVMNGNDCNNDDDDHGDSIKLLQSFRQHDYDIYFKPINGNDHLDRLNPEWSLERNLINKYIIEYPTFVVCFL